MSSSPQIFTATDADVPEVEAVLEASYSKLLVPFYEAATLRAVLPLITRPPRALVTSGRYYLVRAEDGQAAAVGGWSHEAPGPAGKVVQGLAHLRFIGTHPDRTGQGLGRRLLGHIFDRAAAEGVRTFDCLSTLAAVGFYERHGFRPVGPFEIPMGEGVSMPTLRMIRGPEAAPLS